MTNPESVIPTEELIKSGEITGRPALEYLQQTGLYAFHGSSYKGEELKPQQAKNKGQDDGLPAVAAATGINAPIFRSLINRTRYLKNLDGMQSAWTSSDNITYFLALQDIYDSLGDEDSGYVYALSLNNQHDLVRNEVRFSETVKPDFTVETHKQDLPLVITEQDFNDQKDQLSQLNILITFSCPQNLEHFYHKLLHTA